MSRRILFTGGGSAGHVMPNVALIESARQRGWQVGYAGTRAGIERELIRPLNVPYFAVASGKLRRYFSWRNFTDPFLIAIGVVQALLACLRFRPDCVFSKGGFVSVPVVAAAWLCRIPVVCHESDVTPGLANRLAFPFCSRICVTFEETAQYVDARKVRVTGTPLRESLVQGNSTEGLRYLGFDGAKPVLLIVGGSLGAEAINQQVWRVVPNLCETFDVIHVVGNGNVRAFNHPPEYVQREFIGDEFGHVLAAASLVVSRAGAGSLYELHALRKPHLLIPLSRQASRGDQIDNAGIFESKGVSHVIQEDALTDDAFLAAVDRSWQARDATTARLKAYDVKDSVTEIMALLEDA